MVTYTAVQQFVKLPQFVVETTQGTTPTASPSFTTCGSCTSLEVRKLDEITEIGQVGQEDLLDLAQGRFTYNATINLQFAATTLLKRWVNAANFVTPAGTISDSLSILYSQLLNGATENFFLLKGCRPKRITLTSDIGQPLKAVAEVESMNISKPITTANAGLTTPTFASNPSGAQWTWLSGGTTPIKWGGIALNAKSVSCTIERNTAPVHILGSGSPAATLPHARRISGSFTVAYTASEATTLETDFDSNTTRTLQWQLESSVTNNALFIDGCEITDYSRSHSADDNDVLIETVNFKGISALLP